MEGHYSTAVEKQNLHKFAVPFPVRPRNSNLIEDSSKGTLVNSMKPPVNNSKLTRVYPIGTKKSSSNFQSKGKQKLDFHELGNPTDQVYVDGSMLP